MVRSTLWERGEWTDDTAMALELATSLVEHGGYDADDVFARYALWARSGPKDIGATVSAVVPSARRRRGARAASRLPPASAGKSAGNGSLMRTVPIALRYSRDEGRARARVSRLDSSLTHHDPLAGDACAWFNLNVAALCAGGGRPRRPRRWRPRPRRRSAPTRDARGRGAGADGLRTDRASGRLRGGVWARQLRACGGVRRQPRRRCGHQRGGCRGARRGPFGAAAIPERWLEPLHQRAPISGLATRLLRA